MTVTVKLEDSRPDANIPGAYWVARDEQGIWNNYAALHFASSAAASVATMYHACEVVSVDDQGEHAVVTLAN